MPLFDKNEHKVHFVHIPRTGGRYVSKIFEENGFNSKYTELNPKENMHGVMKMHLYFPLYKKLEDYDQRCEFCVVRNPFNKFISSITPMCDYFNNNLEYLLESQDTFFNFIMEHQLGPSLHNSWFLEQYKFISPKTKVWKYESGFGDDFLEWIYKNFNIELNPIEDVKFDDEIWGGYKEKFKTKKYEFSDTDTAKKYIKLFYKKDYEMFGYS